MTNNESMPYNSTMSNSQPLTAELQSKLQHLPQQPGVYLMKNVRGEILYIGKALVLADRVRSYFLKGTDPTPKTIAMLRQLADIESIVTGSEVEALSLELNLVKPPKPRSH